MSRHFDVILIGSGISALTAAALLAKKGKSVALLEQYNKPGGYMHSFRRFDEHFDTGAHYFGALGEKQPFRVLLEYLDVYREDLFSPLDPAGFDEFCYPEGRIVFPQGYDQVKSELSAVFPNEKSAITAYFDQVEKVCHTFPTYRYNDESGFMPEGLELSLAAFVESLTSNTRLQAVFYAYSALHGVHPRDVAFGFHAIVTDSLIRGAYGLNGTGDRLTNAFVQQIEKSGGKLFCRHKVTALNIQDRHVRQVKCANGAEFSADWVISTIHPKATFRLLSDQSMLPPVFKDRLKNIPESLGLFGVYATCSSRPSHRPARNYYFFETSRPYDLFRAINPGDTPPAIFMATPQRQWPDSSSKFPISLHAAGPFEWFAPYAQEPYGRRSNEYKALKDIIAAALLRGVEKYEPDLPEKISHTVTSTPLTHLHFNGSEEGSSYGIYHSIQNTGARALGPRTKVLNLLLAGQNCLFPGLLGAATSALRTCGHIVGIKPILQELKQRSEA